MELELERPPVPATPPAAGTPEWNAAKKIGFRFLVAYTVLYSLQHLLGNLPLLGVTAGPWLKLMDASVLWLGRHLFGLTITVRPAGSGDTTWNYVQLIFFLIAAALITAVWTAADRKRPDYARLYDWLRVFVRYTLGTIIIGYGAYKVVPSQFPFPFIDRMLEPLGNFSPMGLLWTFMGYSAAYNVFCGLVELTGGIFLFYRRTTTLGALLSLLAMGNVVMLNYAYDVPVKLFSTHLLAMAIFLLAPDARRLIDTIVLNRASTARPETRPFRDRRLNIAGFVLGQIILGWALYSTFALSIRFNRQFAGYRTNTPLYGVYDVESFALNHDTLPPLITDTVRWRRAVFYTPNAIAIHLMNDAQRGFRAQTDTAGHTLSLITGADTTKKAVLAWTRPDSTHLTLDGVLRGDTIHVRMKRFDEQSFFLISRGYHWINERPLNR